MRAFQQGQNHQFIPNTSFEDILELYIFDRKLRVLIIDAIERIEVALRSILTNTMALNDTHWYQDDRYFKNSSIHSNILENIKNDIGEPCSIFCSNHMRFCVGYSFDLLIQLIYGISEHRALQPLVV